MAGERFCGCRDLRGLALRDEIATGIACAGAEVHDKIGAADGVFVVLDHEHGVAQIAELLERAEQALVVTRVRDR